MVTECDNLIYTPVNALMFRVTGNTECLKPVIKNGIITQLEGPKGLTISLGLTLKIKRVKYKINIIEKVKVNKKIRYNI